MNIKLEFNDEGVIYELMDIIVLAHLKTTKTMLEAETISELDTGNNAEIISALHILIGYYGR
jgi:hypothetical protein